MNYYEMSSTNSVRGRFTPGIMLYTSPIYSSKNKFGASVVAPQKPTYSEHQERTQSPRLERQHRYSQSERTL